MSPPPNLAEAPFIEAARKVLTPLARYHAHRVEGLEHVPAEGAVLLVTNHSLATYDGFLLGMAIYDATGRLPTGLGDDLLFKVPGLQRVVRGLGLMPASPANAGAMVDAGHIVGLAPGGMREALRPSHEAGRVRWGKRRGFARMSVLTGAPILLAACPRADELYTVYENRLTKLAYRALKVPLPLARGLGPTLLPRPIPLTHYIAPLIHPPTLEPEAVEAQIEAVHARALEQMTCLMEAGGL